MLEVPKNSISSNITQREKNADILQVARSSSQKQETPGVDDVPALRTALEQPIDYREVRELLSLLNDVHQSDL